MRPRLTLLCLVMVAGSALLAAPVWMACDRRPARRPDVILIVIDTLRADHLGAYGYDRDTSPVLDAFACETGIDVEVRWGTALFKNGLLKTWKHRLHRQWLRSSPDCIRQYMVSSATRPAGRRSFERRSPLWTLSWRRWRKR